MKDNGNKKVIKKRKFKLVKFLIVLLILYLFSFFSYKIIISPIKNIFILNNNYLTDQEIIDLSGLRDYPSFILMNKTKVKKKLLKNELINDVTIKKKLFGIIYIDIKENTPLFYYSNESKTVLEDKSLINKDDFIVPTLINYVDDEIMEVLVDKYNSINNEIRVMISEMKYVPNDIDKKRFLLTMNDGNYVYVTLYKMSSINEYIKILSTLEDKKGILYLDSGNYFEIFK